MDQEGNNVDEIAKEEESIGSVDGPVVRNVKRKTWSKAWDEFTAIYVAGKVEKAECNHCHSILTSRSCNGTSNLLNHLKKCTRRVNKNRKQQKLPFLPSAQRSPAVADMDTQQQKLVAVPAALKNWEFDQEASREELARMIVLHGYPPSMVEQDGFRRFAACLNPMFKMVSCDEVKDDCISLFKREKAKLKERFAQSCNRVSLSVHLWNYDEASMFLCLTAHYIDDEWKMQKKIIKFCWIEPSCNPTAVCEVILEGIREWGLDGKVFSITMDDTIESDLVASNLKENLSERNSLPMKGKLFQFHCAAGILKCIARDGLTVMDSIMHDARKTVKHTNHLAHLASLESICRNAPCHEEWKMVEIVCQLLRTFSRAGEKISGFDDSTSSFHYDELWKVKRALHFQVSNGNKAIANVVMEMLKKFNKYWNSYYLHLAIPVILDPRHNIRFVRRSFITAFDGNAQGYISEMHEAMHSLFNEYLNSSHAENPSSATSSQHDKETVVHGDDVLLDHNGYIIAEERGLAWTELERYFKDDGEHFHVEKKFDVLSWWKVHGPRYPIIARMARDFLAIPPSTECKSAILTARNAIYQFGGKSSSVPIEAIVCTRDWLRSSASQASMESIHDFKNENSNLPMTPSSFPGSIGSIDEF